MEHRLPVQQQIAELLTGAVSLSDNTLAELRCLLNSLKRVGGSETQEDTITEKKTRLHSLSEVGNVLGDVMQLGEGQFPPWCLHSCC